MLEALLNPKGRYGIAIASPDDHTAIEAISNQCFSEGWQSHQLDKLFASPAGMIWVAREKSSPHSRISAYLLMHYVEPEGEVLSIGVDPGHRGQGLGKIILETAFDQLRFKHANLIHLEVSDHNVSAIRLYEKLGFQVVDRRKAYYTSRAKGEHADALMMQLRLSLPTFQ